MARQEAIRRRFWVESALATVTGLLAVITLFTRDWIEVVFGVDPDHGSGSLEWALIAVLVVATLVVGSLARMEWRRPQPA